MRIVQQSFVAVTKFAMKQRQAHTAVRDVGNRGDDLSRIGQERADSPQQDIRLAQMFQHVGKENDVKSFVTKELFKIQCLGVTNDDLLTMLARKLACFC